MAENRIPCPNCTDGFITTGDRHARTGKDVCPKCYGIGMVAARTGETPQASYQPSSEPTASTSLSPRDQQRARVEGEIRRAFDRASEEDGRLENAHDAVVDLLDTVIGAVDRILLDDTRGSSAGEGGGDALVEALAKRIFTADDRAPFPTWESLPDDRKADYRTDAAIRLATPGPAAAGDGDLRAAAQALLDACVADFGYGEDGSCPDADDSAVGGGTGGDMAVQFGHMRRLRAAIARTPAPPDVPAGERERIDVAILDDGWEWAVVEVMGHRRHAGRIREVERFGAKMIRVDVPAKGDPDAHGWTTHFYPGGALFSFTPCTREAALKANKPYDEPTRLSYRSAEHDWAEDRIDG